MNKQTLIEQRIYYLHQRIIQKLQENPKEILSIAHDNLKRYRKRNGDWRSYLDWEQRLSLPVKDIINVLNSQEEDAILARSNSPFAGCISARERWRILKKVNRKYETS